MRDGIARQRQGGHGLATTGWPAWLRKTARLLFGLAVTALIWESAVLLFAIRPVYLPRLSTILMAIAATPAPMSMASCGH